LPVFTGVLPLLIVPLPKLGVLPVQLLLEMQSSAAPVASLAAAGTNSTLPVETLVAGPALSGPALSPEIVPPTTILHLMAMPK